MRTKLLFSGAIIIILVVVLVSVIQAQSSDRPPGVNQKNWVAISGNAGIVVSSTTRPTYGGVATARGTLYIKSDGYWKKFYPDHGQVEFMPVPRE
jgi:hypothetical protein